MDIEVKIDPNYTTPKMTFYTSELTPEIADLIKKLSTKDTGLITGYKEEVIFLLPPDSIYCFFTESQHVLAQTKEGLFKIKNRLYEIEEMLSPPSFVRISQSEIINFSYVESLDMQLNGTIRLKLKNNDYHFVSRRFVNKIKTYLKL